MKACISRKFFCLLLTVVMVCTLLPITALAAGPSGSIESAGITRDNGVLKNAVSVELKDVTFAKSVAIKLYSGDTLLTTATLQGVNPGSYNFLTCCIATETADEYWALTPWTPKDNVVPNKVVLFVDDNEMGTMEFTLDAAEWKALPGTVRPSSNVTNGTASNNALQYKDADKTTPAPAATATPAPATTATPAPAATATPQYTIPQTGDTSNPALLVVLMLVSGSAAIGTAVVASKRKNNR